MEYRYNDYNSDKDNENDRDKNTYNVYINSDRKNKNKRKKSDNNSSLDNFLYGKKSDITNEIIEEEYIPDEYSEYSEEYIAMQEKKIYFCLNTITARITGALLLILVIYNIFCISSLKKKVETNLKEIATDEIILESKINKLNETSQEDLPGLFNAYGYIYSDKYKTISPYIPSDITDYITTTNWFDIICNSLYSFLSK